MDAGGYVIAGTIIGGFIGFASAFSVQLRQEVVANRRLKVALHSKLAGITSAYVQSEITRNQAYIWANYHERMRFAKGVDTQRHKQSANEDLQKAQEQNAISSRLKKELDELIADIDIHYNSSAVVDSLEVLRSSQQIRSLVEFPQAYDYDVLTEIRIKYDEDVKKTIKDNWKTPLVQLRLAMKDELRAKGYIKNISSKLFDF
jgi:hypothetical protein